MDDARLVVLNAVDLRNRGGAVLTRTSLESARREGDQWRVDLRNVRDGQSLAAASKVIVNAAGPWVETVLHRAGRNAENRVRLVKGSHIITRKFWNGDQAYLLQNSDKRVIFVNPYEGDLVSSARPTFRSTGEPRTCASTPTKSNISFPSSIATSGCAQGRRRRPRFFRACARFSTTRRPTRAR